MSNLTNWWQKAIQFLKETRREMEKVTWPSKNEVISFTTVVIIISIVVSFYLAIVDLLLSKGLNLLLK